MACIGRSQQTASDRKDFLAHHELESIVDGYHYRCVQVNDFLQVEGHSNWFAIGDITSLSDYRLGRLAQDQGKLAAGQIKALHHGGKLKAWKKHNGLEVIIVSLGRKDGAAAAWGWGWSGWLPTVMKSRDLLGGDDQEEPGTAQGLITLCCNNMTKNCNAAVLYESAFLIIASPIIEQSHCSPGHSSRALCIQRIRHKVSFSSCMQTYEFGHRPFRLACVNDPSTE